jgi:hypothetical protein
MLLAIMADYALRPERIEIVGPSTPAWGPAPKSEPETLPARRADANSDHSKLSIARASTVAHDRAGVFRRHLDHGEHVEIVIGERVYRVRMAELR